MKMSNSLGLRIGCSIFADDLDICVTVETICSIEHLSPDTVSVIIFKPIGGLTRLHESCLPSKPYSEAFGLLQDILDQLKCRDLELDPLHAGQI